MQQSSGKAGEERRGHSREERRAWRDAMRQERMARIEANKERERIKHMTAPAPVWDGKSGLLLPDDIRLIKMLTGLLPDSLMQVVDLGAGSGTSALSVFTARQDRIRVASVDISGVALDATRKNMQQYGYIPKWTGIPGRSDVIAKGWKRPVHLLLEDATHDYASKQDSLLAWFRHMKPGALVWSHEYNLPSHYPGVMLCIDELVEAGRLETIEVAGYGWAGRFLG